jgi:drug/metabolite transporter (DMT)-like permease
MIPLANAIVLFYTFPLFVVLFSFLLFRAAIEKGEMLLIGVGLVGIYILTNPDFHSFSLGYMFGLLSSCLGGMAMVLIHKARQTNDPFIIYFYFCLVGGILCFPFFIQGFRLPNVQYWILLVSVALMLLVAQVLMNHGLKFCKASEGSLMMMSEVVFAGIGGVLIFKDPVTPNFLTGAFLIMGSGIGLNLMSRRSRHSPVSSAYAGDRGLGRGRRRP